MTTKLEKPLRREIAIRDEPFVVTLAPEGFKLVGKGRRKGLEISWEDLTSGEAALATALRASITGDVPLAPSAKNAAKRSSGKRTKGARRAR
jgi:hypothetical protein